MEGGKEVGVQNTKIQDHHADSGLTAEMPRLPKNTIRQLKLRPAGGAHYKALCCGACKAVCNRFVI